MDHRQLCGKALLVCPHVLIPLTHDALAVIGQDGHILPGGKFAELRDELRSQLHLIQGLAGHAVHDLAAVVGQHTAALFVQPQLLCQRQNARRGAAGGQHDGHALCGGGIQRRAGAGGNDLFVIGQGAVQVQSQHPDIRSCHDFYSSFSGRGFPPDILLLTHLFYNAFPFL